MRSMRGTFRAEFDPKTANHGVRYFEFVRFARVASSIKEKP
jgi:hypothetical protein